MNASTNQRKENSISKIVTEGNLVKVYNHEKNDTKTNKDCPQFKKGEEEDILKKYETRKRSKQRHVHVPIEGCTLL